MPPSRAARCSSGCRTSPVRTRSGHDAGRRALFCTPPEGFRAMPPLVHQRRSAPPCGDGSPGALNVNGVIRRARARGRSPASGCRCSGQGPQRSCAMKSTYFALAAFLVGACGLAGTAAAQGSAAESVGPQAVPDARRLELAESYGRSPLRFEANQGQTDGRVKFLSRGNGYALFLTPAEAVLTLRTPAGSGRDAVLRMKLLGSNPSPIITGEEELPGKSNYFIGHDPKRWRTRVSNYGRARFAGVYPGVDLVFYGNRRQLEYDFVVAPGADPSSITLGFAGADSLQIGPQGELTLQVRGGEVTWRKPVVYQEVAGVRRMVPGRYVRKGRTAVGFEVAPYDRRQPLILDPVLAYSTYLGGSDTDEGHGIAVDSSGNAYVTGVTYSTDFPAFPASAFQTVLSGNRDAFVTKLDAGG